MLTDYPNGISSMGVPVLGNGLPATFGKYIFVNADTGSDGNDGLSIDTPVKTVAKALTLATTNKDDVIALSCYGAHTISSLLDVSINRVHFVALGARSGLGMGPRAKLVMGVTTAATDIAVMQNTGVGNTFTGIKFDSSNTKAESLYAVAEGGEYTIYNMCEFYKSSDLNETAAAEVLNNGDSAQWLNCVFGSSADTIADDKIRPNMLLTRETITGKVCRDNIIDNCIFLSKAGGTEHVAIYGANATDVERMFLVKNSVFYNNPLSAKTPAHAVGFGSAQTEGCVILKNCTSVDYTVMAQAAMNIYVDGAVPTFATTGVSVAA